MSSQLDGDRHQINHLNYTDESTSFLKKNKEKIDCLILFDAPQTLGFIASLNQEGILLPTVIYSETKILPEKSDQEAEYYCHSAEQYLPVDQWSNLDQKIGLAIADFLHLAPSCAILDIPHSSASNDNRQAFLLLQQRRLAEKLRERLGYLGVYYKRNPQYFYRNLSPEEQEEFKQQFINDYREIILNYFNEEPPINQAVDQFVNQAFFADISVSYLLETHMKLIDEFAQQLKLEGRSEDILLDYRLTLIDIVAHLCEMYRRSIPREDLPFELLFQID
ncbi:MAG: circadian clock protein KaiA [Limnothrix sp. RL_2_0]|nr:circadian clock protein KaiA [Limnothrix sp. RL_2_0]